MLRPSGKYVYVMPRCRRMSSGKRKIVPVLGVSAYRQFTGFADKGGGFADIVFFKFEDYVFPKAGFSVREAF